MKSWVQYPVLKNQNQSPKSKTSYKNKASHQKFNKYIQLFPIVGFFSEIHQTKTVTQTTFRFHSTHLQHLAQYLLPGHLFLPNSSQQCGLSQQRCQSLELEKAGSQAIILSSTRPNTNTSGEKVNTTMWIPVLWNELSSSNNYWVGMGKVNSNYILSHQLNLKEGTGIFKKWKRGHFGTRRPKASLLTQQVTCALVGNVARPKPVRARG